MAHGGEESSSVELCVLLLQGSSSIYRGRGEVEPPWDTPPQGAAAKEVGQGRDGTDTVARATVARAL